METLGIGYELGVMDRFGMQEGFWDWGEMDTIRVSRVRNKGLGRIIC